MVLVVLADRVELRGHPADPMVPLSGELVASARPSDGGWAVRWRDGRLVEVCDRDAAQEMLIGHMKR